MKRSLLIIGIVVFLPVSCGGRGTQLADDETVQTSGAEEAAVATEAEEAASATEAEEEILATDPEDIVGMWTRDLEGSATSYYFKEDGTFNLLLSRDPEKLQNSPGLVGEYWFDGSQVNMKDVEQFIATSIGLCAEVGVYEVVILETGNLLFRQVDDDCAERVDNLVGPGFVDLEFKPLQGASQAALVSSAENMVGTWQGIKGTTGYMVYRTDGTWTYQEQPEDVGYSPVLEGEIWFEGGHLHIKQTTAGRHIISCEEIVGSYEVSMLPNGNHRFFPVEDECEGRVSYFAGRPGSGIDVEFKPLP